MTCMLFFSLFDVILRELDVDKICDVLFSLLIRSFSLTLKIHVRDYLDFLIFWQFHAVG